VIKQHFFIYSYESRKKKSQNHTRVIFLLHQNGVVDTIQVVPAVQAISQFLVPINLSRSSCLLLQAWEWLSLIRLLWEWLSLIRLLLQGHLRC
jgi:hypothetical protein